jgi:hypothetical protein
MVLIANDNNYCMSFSWVPKKKTIVEITRILFIIVDNHQVTGKVHLI